MKLEINYFKSFDLKNNVENVSVDSDMKVLKNSVENRKIKNNDFISIDSPESSDDENVTKIIILLIPLLNMYHKIAHMIMFK